MIRSNCGLLPHQFHTEGDIRYPSTMPWRTSLKRMRHAARTITTNGPQRATCVGAHLRLPKVAACRRKPKTMSIITDFTASEIL